MQTIDPTCPECASDDLQALTIVTVLARDPVYLYRDDRGNVIGDPDTGELNDAEPLDTDRDGTRYVCGDCGYEGEPEDWSAAASPNPEESKP